MGKDIGAECLHENLKVLIQAGVRRGLLNEFKNNSYWCKLCNRYIHIDKLMEGYNNEPKRQTTGRRRND